MSSAETEPHLDVISTIERVGSALSLLGCLFIILTFCYSEAFRKPINRLVFYASFGNMMTVIGTLMARTYIGRIDSFGCQFQAFLIQMFMPADAYWILAMAVNVWLTFYCKYDAGRLRSMEIWYLLICYGVPFIPALTYIFIATEERGRMFGDATLWCWVTSGWDIFRIATFYGPVWVTIIITFFIYIRAGGDIYKKRKLLRNFSSSHDRNRLTIENPFTLKTTEVTVTSEITQEALPGTHPPNARIQNVITEPPSDDPNAIYSVKITSDPTVRPPAAAAAAPVHENTARPVTRSAEQKGGPRFRANVDINKAVWSYTKCALLFFTALLVTWIPSSANRLYSVIYPNQMSWPLEYLSAIVLPLQGFWNTVIYVSTSWSAVKMMFEDLLLCRSPQSSRSRSRASDFFITDFQRNRRVNHSRKYFGSESVTELADPREMNSGWGGGTATP